MKWSIEPRADPAAPGPLPRDIGHEVVFLAAHPGMLDEYQGHRFGVFDREVEEPGDVLSSLVNQTDLAQVPIGTRVFAVRCHESAIYRATKALSQS